MQQVTTSETTLEHAPTGLLECMDQTGDTKVEWNRHKPEEVAAAKASFDVLKGKGYAAFKLSSDGTKGDQIREFDPEAGRILMAPPLGGG